MSGATGDAMNRDQEREVLLAARRPAKNDLVEVDLRIVQVLRVVGETVVFRYLDGGCDAVPIERTKVVAIAPEGEPKPGARFRTWWENAGERGEAIATYERPVTYDGDLSVHWSDSCAVTLVENGFAIPPTPSFDIWKRDILRKRRCVYCPKILKGTMADWARHREVCHKISPSR